MGPKRWMALIVVALGGISLVMAPGASACPKNATNCKEHGDITMNPKSTGSQSTDVVPSGSTKGTEFVTPFTPKELAEFDDNWDSIVDSFPKLGKIPDTASGKFVKRVITCAIFAKNVPDLYSAMLKQRHASLTAQATDTSEVYLSYCLQVVYATQTAGVTPSGAGDLALAGVSTVSHAASGTCSTAVVSIPLELSRSGNKITAQLDATPARAKGVLKVSCKVKGTGLQITMKPRAQGKKLHQVVGNHMRIGFSNPTSQPVKIHTVFGFSG